MSDRPMYRFWNAGGAMEPDEVADTLDAMVRVGAGGLESANFIEADAPGYDAPTQQWGTPLWSQRMKELYRGGEKRDLQVDTLYTPNWSAGTPTVNPDEAGSAKEIDFAHRTITPGTSFSGSVPTTELPEGVQDRELVAALAYECAADCTGEELPTLEQNTVVDLTSEVDGEGRLEWAAPGDGTSWVLVTAWMHGTGQVIGKAGTADTSYLVDHFDRSGFDAIAKFWEDKVLTPQLRAAMETSGGSLFFDSLELNRGGLQVRNWTHDFLAEFRKRRGYSLVPYLPVVGVPQQFEGGSDLPDWAAVDPLPEFDFADPTLADRVQQDYAKTLSDLFLDEHLKPLQRWAHQVGLTVRGQPYASWGPSPLDVQTMYRNVDIAEGESRSFGRPPFSEPVPFVDTRSNDVWRAMASAVASVDNKLVSTECCASGSAWHIPRQTLLSYMNQQFAVGVNHIVYHGWSDKPTALSQSWPGWEAFSGGVADSYGPHNPQFADDRQINDYVARTQHVLRAGELRTDVAVYREGNGHSLAGLSGSPYLANQALARAGYTYGFMNQDMVTDPSLDYRGAMLDVDGPRYKALIYNGTDNEENYDTMALESAQQLDRWARRGLPIVVVGRTPTRVTGLHPDKDADLRATFDRLLARRSVVHIENASDLPAVLRSLGVRPAAQFSEPSPLLTQRRQTSDTNYYFIWNSDADARSSTVTLEGEGTPYVLNAWTGESEPIAEYKRVGADHITVNVDLAGADATIIALSRTGAGGVPVVSTNAEKVEFGHGKGDYTIRADETGSVRVKLQNGKVLRTNVDRVRPVKHLKAWTVDVTSYQAGDTPVETAHVDLGSFAVPTGGDGKLEPWSDIAGLEQVSGIGNYRTTVKVGQHWPGGTSMLLDLGEVLGTYNVSVNGRRLPAQSQLDTSAVDLRGYLHPGTNTIDVEVATLLGNVVENESQPYGLIGPVKLRPYVEKTLVSRGR
jgi:hypothetical protein